MYYEIAGIDSPYYGTCNKLTVVGTGSQCAIEAFWCTSSPARDGILLGELLYLVQCRLVLSRRPRWLLVLIEETNGTIFIAGAAAYVLGRSGEGTVGVRFRCRHFNGSGWQAKFFCESSILWW